MGTKRIFLKLATVAVLVCAPAMHAAITQELTVSDGLGDSFSIDQNGNIVSQSGTVSIVAGNISVDGVGSISVTSDLSGTVKVGTFKINSASAFGLADSIPPQLQDEESLDTTSTGTGTLTIKYTDTTYSHLASSLMLSGSESTSNTPLTSVAFTATGANGAVIPATGAIGSLGPLSGSSNSSTKDFANSFTGASASLTSTSTITFSGAGTFNTTFDIASGVPEPASIALLGTMLFGLAGLLRRKAARRV
jgi:hypothetical protein